jgi:DHA1 family bicyclomycin/chloramphenicol resistance-like MFS transporter
MFAYIARLSLRLYRFLSCFHDRLWSLLRGERSGLHRRAQVNVRLVRRFPTDLVIAAVLLTQTSASLLLLAGTWTGWIGLYGTAFLVFVYMASVGCLFPNTTALAMAEHGDKAGSASALIGVLQFTLAAIAAFAVGALNNGKARSDGDRDCRLRFCCIRPLSHSLVRAGIQARASTVGLP